MKINRPLSPHLTIHKPQLTSTPSIFHRISGAFSATMVLVSLLSSKVGHLSLTSENYYRYAFSLTNDLHWLILSLVNSTLSALCYHMSNGVRHLWWDLGFVLDLSRVYTSGILMLFRAARPAFMNLFRFFRL
uniref:Succinate dehydrogenase cytochrome subunit 3 n=1 Tax=Psilotum nudum TaxID=3240 RepID=A0A1B3TRK0_PSINU|nr:succinate dehydrogenase cytochrome subunit 3 [Psilotum nudum]